MALYWFKTVSMHKFALLAFLSDNVGYKIRLLSSLTLRGCFGVLFADAQISTMTTAFEDIDQRKADLTVIWERNVKGHFMMLPVL